MKQALSAKSDTGADFSYGLVIILGGGGASNIEIYIYSMMYSCDSLK